MFLNLSIKVLYFNKNLCQPENKAVAKKSTYQPMGYFLLFKKYVPPQSIYTTSYYYTSTSRSRLRR